MTGAGGDGVTGGREGVTGVGREGVAGAAMKGRGGKRVKGRPALSWAPRAELGAPR